jgi:putative toxin-antitoxin system antitoxin component (TIGR02293 family)
VGVFLSRQFSFRRLRPICDQDKIDLYLDHQQSLIGLDMGALEKKPAARNVAGPKRGVGPVAAYAPPVVGGASHPTTFQGDATEIIRKMRAGTPARVIPILAARLGLSQERLFETLKLPKSTMKARISDNALLSSAEQDRVYRAEKVWTRALGVLEDELAAKRWITRENRSLGGEAPLSMLDTEAGYELVLDTLGRIEFGVVS